jgi:tetratricopeptide (TPR) repeat protein/predicted Ser/Thr protein kinase
MRDESQVDRDSPTVDRLGRPPELAAFEIDLAMRTVMARVIGRIRDVELGRYRVKQRLGQGGCGLVLLAEDPELGREVAIKVVLPARHANAGSTWQRALQREAKALAQLRHPNVVEVFDAGVTDSTGEHTGVYVVMERLVGRTLRQWLGHEVRDWREIVRVHLEAANGLAAAHAAGIVHRDFKPDNVMLTDDGRVVLIDFGLANLAESFEADTSVTARLAIGTMADDQTHSGGSRVVGTPAYMAPEQHDGLEITPAADQFAWCASLFSALYGAAPFAGRDLAELAAAKREGRFAITARGPARRLLRVLRRGLAAASRDRFVDMHALARAVQRATSGAARRPWIGVTAASLAIAGTAAAGFGPQHPCDAPERSRGTGWAFERRAEVDRAVGRLADPHAAATASRVLSRLDDHARDWEDANRTACTTRGDEAQISARVDCLDRAADQMQRVAAAFVDLDVEHIGNAAALLESLHDPAACIDAPPLAAAHREELTALWRRADEIGVGVDAVGKIADEAAAQADLARAEALGDPALVATLAWRLGQVERAAARFEPAAQHMRTAVLQAAAAHDFARALDMIAHLVLVTGADLGDYAEAVRLVDHAEAMAEHIDDPRAPLATLDNAMAYVHIEQGRYDEAIVLYRRAMATFEQLDTPSLEHARTLLAIASWSAEQGQFEEAARLRERTREILDAIALPTDSMYAALAFSDAGEATRRGDHAAAARLYREAVERLRPRLHGHPYIAIALNALGLAEATLGRFDEALAAADEACTIVAAIRGPVHHDPILYGSMRAQAAWYADRDDVAKTAIETAVTSIRDMAEPGRLLGIVHHLAVWIAVDRGDTTNAAASLAVARAAAHDAAPPGIDEARSLRRLEAMVALGRGDASAAADAMRVAVAAPAEPAAFDASLESQLDALVWDRIAATGIARDAAAPATDPSYRADAGSAVVFAAMARAIRRGA